MVASDAEAGILPMVTPPSLVQASPLSSLALPTPTTTRRDTSSPVGATMSKAAPFLPLNRSAAAARSTRSPAEFDDFSRGRPEFEAVFAEHNENTPGGR